MQGGPSDYLSISSSSRKERNYGSMNLDGMLHNFWDTEGNQVMPNSNQDTPIEGQHLSYVAENGMGGDHILEQVTVDFNVHHPSDQIATNENEIPNSASDVSEPPSSGRRRRRSSYDDQALTEKRQRRMIKNRESAARSRARKEAYTAELEVELDRMREENDRLKLLVAQVATKRKEEEEKKNQPTKAQWMADKLRTLRRMSSV
ncbi:ABSCISIC ACID-INSENSITIVE 5-like protein 2 [Lycium ferocissimum]|uniref:ABSCISIC ACID-INSENSITIVE 5-like protein 2 n=1 Tax=Lycium ferocissimum TaxID=112874 RepID=UPI002814D4B7|nr:ABSCISIC ACID-INSENSITIVE 5-like protein 2 [Lycium ferocissimum]